jgi:hypothetical protein
MCLCRWSIARPLRSPVASTLLLLLLLSFLCPISTSWTFEAEAVALFGNSRSPKSAAASAPVAVSATLLNGCAVGGAWASARVAVPLIS